MARKIERTIWLFTFLIVVIGLICLYSASFGNVRVAHEVFYDQLICALLGFGLMYFLQKFDYRKFYDAAYIIYILNLFVLMLVLFAGHNALGARRWFTIGSINFQPSEFTKLAAILILGRYFSTRRPTLAFNLFTKTQIIWRDLILPFLIITPSFILIFKQPDLGTALLLFGIFLVIVFMSGVEYRHLLIFLGLGLCLIPFAWHFLKSYQKDRLLVFLNPNIDPLGAGYTIIQSKIAVGSGQILGKGWLAGTQSQLNFLPERHTDFIFAVIGEEWGFVGVLVLISCYFVLINCGLTIAQQVKDKFGMLVAVGIVSILTLQVVINIGMVIGLLPIVGLTLPLVSYGRSSFLVFIIMMGFLLNLNQRRNMV